MTIRTCIRLSTESNESTRAYFFAAIEQLAAMFEHGFSVKTPQGRERIYPISVAPNRENETNLIWFSISNADYIPHFKSLSRVVMERNRVGDKYQIIMNPGPTSAT